MSPKAKHNKKILLILRTPPPFGGGEVIHQSLFQHYSQNDDYRVLVVSSQKRNKGNQSAFAIWKLYEFFCLLIKIAFIFCFKKPRLIFFAMGKAFPHFLRDSMLVWIAKLMFIPVAAEIHGSGLYFAHRFLLGRYYAKLVCNNMVSIRVLGDSIQKEFASYGINNTIIIDNGVSVSPSRYHNSFSNDPGFNILYAGTIGKHKGFDLVMNACNKLKMRPNKFTIHCLGQWSSEQYQRDSMSFIQKSNLSQHFIFYGLRHGEEKWEIFRSCDVLVLPSYNEGQPLVILEAFAFGLAVISSSVGAIPDTVKHGVNGLLIQPGSEDGLYDSIYDLINNKSLLKQMQNTNLKAYDKQYSLANFLANYEHWIKECAAMKSGKQKQL
jgi:glycosyltransferase involved in cell wall biosynthesis